MASSQSQRTGAAGGEHQADSSRGASPGERQPSDQQESRAAQGSLASLALPRPLPSRLVFAVQGQVCPKQSGGRAETMTHGFQGADGKVEGREPKGPEASRTNMTCSLQEAKRLLYQALSRAIPKVLVGAPGIPGSWVQTGRIPFWGGCSKSPPAPGGSPPKAACQLVQLEKEPICAQELKGRLITAAAAPKRSGPSPRKALSSPSATRRGTDSHAYSVPWLGCPCPTCGRRWGRLPGAKG